MDIANKLKFIKNNIVVDDYRGYYLDCCDKCHIIVLHSADYRNQERKDGDFLDKCLTCHLKLCDNCTWISCAMDPTYCKDCKKNSDFVECSNCKRKCFDYCTIRDGQRLAVNDILCCRHCELDLFVELEYI